MGELIAKLKFPVLLLIAGALLILPAMLVGLSPANFNPQPRSPISWPLLIPGFAFVALGVLAFLVEVDKLPILGRGRVRKAGDGFALSVGRVNVTVAFGRLEEVIPSNANGERQLVVLPTNEFFDDACSSSANTACGAYVRAKMPNQGDQFRSELMRQLEAMPTVGEFEKDDGQRHRSYGAGTCLYLETPPGVAHSILLAAATTKRAGTGFQSNPAYIYQCIDRVAAISTDKRIGNVYLPLLGAGKGGLTPIASLLTILLSISTLQRRLGGFDSSVNVVVFRESPSSAPQVDRQSVLRVLKLIEALHHAR